MVQLVFALGLVTMVAAELGLMLSSRQMQQVEAEATTPLEYLISAAKRFAECENEHTAGMVSPCPRREAALC